MLLENIRALSVTALSFAVLLASSVHCSLVTAGPEDQTLLERESVILPCRTQPGAAVRVIWHRDGVIVAAFRIPPTDRRYQFLRVPANGIHDLKIQDLRIGDQGEYTCQVTSLNQGGSSQPAASVKAFLRVLKNLDGLKLMQRINDSSSVKLEPRSLTHPVQLPVGHPGKLICEAASSNPAASISWTFSDGAVVQVPAFSKQQERRSFERPIKGSAWMEKQELEDKLFTVQSVLQIDGESVTDARNNLLIECHAQVLNYELRPMSASTRLYVTVPPTVSLTIQPARPENEFHEHDTVTAVCSATGRPDNFVYSWSIDSDGAQLPPAAPSASRLTLTLTRRHHGQTIQCTAANHAKSEAKATIRVRYGPKFEPSLPALYAAKIGGSADLSCQADANPEPIYAWRRGATGGIGSGASIGGSNNGPVVGQMSHLRRSNLQPDDFGEYICTVSGAEFSTISRRVLLAEMAPPKCESASQQFARIGRSYRLECRIVSVPVPSSQGGVVWWRNGRKLETGNRVRIYREDFLGGTTAFVHFDEIASNDFGIYNCTATNEVGSDSLLISLTIEDNIPVAFIAGASTALVMVLVFMLVLLCVCRKGYWDSRAAAEQRQSAMEKQQSDRLPADNLDADAGDSDSDNGGPNGVIQGPRINGACRGQQQPQPLRRRYGEVRDDDSVAVEVGPADIGGYPAFVGCAVHGSLGRQQLAPLPATGFTSGHHHHQPQQQRGYHRPASAYPAIDLSDLTPSQQNCLGQALSPAKRSGHQQQLAAAGAAEEPGEEAGQEDSVRSCDSGYGGAHAAGCQLGHHPAAGYQLGSSDSSVDSKLSAGLQQHHVTFHPTPCVIHHYPAGATLPKTGCPIHSVPHGLAAAAAGGSGGMAGVGGGIIRRQPTIDEDHPTTEV